MGALRETMSNLHASEVHPTRDDYFDKFIDLRAKTFEFISRDFGPSRKNLSDGSPNDRYWAYEKLRNRIDDLMSDMLTHIVQARTIWITSLYDYNERRRYINRAIGDCETVIQELQFAIRTLDVKTTKYVNLIEDFKIQINSLRNWRTSDNVIRNRIIKDK